MYYRVTTYGFDASHFDEFVALADSLRNDLQTIEGLEFIHSCKISESEAMIIARYDSEEPANAAQPRIREVLGQMASFVTSQPDMKGGNVIWEL